MDLNVLKTVYHPLNYIKILYHKRSLFIKLLDRNEQIEALNNRLNSANHNFIDKKKYLKFLFKCSTNCDFIIFQSTKEGLFCQFGLKDNYLMMDFPISALNDHLPVLKKVRKLLEKLNFTFTEKDMKYMHYKYNIDDEFQLLDANFGNNIDLAAGFIKEVFEDIFKEDLFKMEIKLGRIGT